MSGPGRGEVSLLLDRSQLGDREAADRLYALVESELRRLARFRMGSFRARMRAEGVEPSQQTTQLIDDAFLNLVGRSTRFADRAHFVGVAAHRMRDLCRDYARRALACKRDRRNARMSLDDAAELVLAPALDPAEFLALDQALERLAAFDARQARIVELRFCGGLTDTEVAECLGVSESTVKREWRSARAWLQCALSESSSAVAG